VPRKAQPEPNTLFPDETLSVPELSQRLNRLLKRELPKEVWIKGEIRNLSRSARGHVYFDLVETASDAGGAPITASIKVVLFDSARQSVNRILKRSGAGRIDDGMEIRIRATVEWYPTGGSLQLRMSTIDPDYTIGRLAADRDALLAALSSEGLLAANEQVPMPLVPQRIGLITSSGSAADADFRHELSRSGFRFAVTSWDSRVQGEAAVESLTRAVTLASSADLDVVVLIRGGGSRTDLSAFDNATLARVIADCRHPVFTGIGHETDMAIADHVAAASFKTPTACATALVERVRTTDSQFAALAHRISVLASWHPQRFHHDLTAVARRVTSASRRAIDDAQRRTTHAAQRAHTLADRQLVSAAERLIHDEHRIRPRSDRCVRSALRQQSEWQRRLVSLAARPTRQQSRDLDNADARVRALDPTTTLRRGFSITRDTDGNVVRTIASLPDELITTVSDGTITSTVSPNGIRAATARSTTAAAQTPSTGQEITND